MKIMIIITNNNNTSNNNYNNNANNINLSLPHYETFFEKQMLPHLV